MTKLEIEAIRKRVEKAKEYGEGVGGLVFEDIPALLAEIERLRGNLRTIEVLTECDTTKDFARRVLIGEATIEIYGGDNE